MNAHGGGRPLLHWAASLGLTLAGHMAVAMLWLCEFRPSPVPPLPLPAEAVMMELSLVPAAPPVPASDLPQGPQQQEQRKQRQQQQRSEQPRPGKPPPRAEPLPLAEPTPGPPVQQAASETPPEQNQQSQDEEHADAKVDVARTSAPPSVQAAPASKYAASQPLAGAAGQSQDSWQAQVLGHLERFKRYPRAARQRNQQGMAWVRYAVDRQGTVLRAGLARSSGNELLDAEAVAAVLRASPLPPPPDRIAHDPVVLITPIEFFLRR